MQLSKYFTLEEMLFSDTAIRKGIDNTPDDKSLKNLKELSLLCLDLIREDLGLPVFVTSGFRCKKLNRLVGGALSPISQHTKGQAADIRVDGMDTEDLYQHIKSSGIEFDQLIQEYDSWVHVSFNKGKNRKQCFPIK